MTPLLENLTNQQIFALQQFKKRIDDVKNPHDTDINLVKWLRSRSYDVQKADIHYREVQAFWKCYEIDAVYDTYTMPEVAEKYIYSSSLGFAKDGSVIRYYSVGHGDHLGFLMSLNAYEVIILATSFIVEDLRLQRKENQRTGKEIHEITYILDYDGFSLRDILHKSVLETGLDLSRLVQEHFPEIWGYIFFINVPSYFDVAYNWFRPILRNTLLSKVKLVSKEKVPIHRYIDLRYIDADVLPQFLGGERVDSNKDPRCSEFIRFGGKIPEKYYYMNGSNPRLLSPDEPDVRSVWIPARGAFNHSIAVHNPGTRFRIEYRCEQGSVIMTKFYKRFDRHSELDMPSETEYIDEKNENFLMLSASISSQAHLVPLDYDGFTAPWPGIYIFRFSNTHSWFGSRNLILRITLVQPKS